MAKWKSTVQCFVCPHLFKNKTRRNLCTYLLGQRLALEGPRAAPATLRCLCGGGRWGLQPRDRSGGDFLPCHLDTSSVFHLSVYKPIKDNSYLS